MVLGDGAAWIWNLADELFPEAIQIVDLFHAKEHLWDVAKAIYGTGTRLKRASMHWTKDSANAILALRCAVLSNRYDGFWQRRRANIAA
ncbi:MAG: hypothetical protein OXH75_25490 [Acidobacteria bacterium]|nr:hypothetical protein [Acidobacteriota bacterium]